MQSNKSEISSSQLMHFVKDKEYLIKILNHNFYPRLCCEDSIKPFFKSNVYVPMKCFCDIPLEYLNDHMKTYGHYGVGFKKSWGEKRGLTPVIYYNVDSPYIQNMETIYNEQMDRLNNSNNDEESSGIAEIIRILKSAFTMYKPIRGKFERRPECGDNYYFYNEREWRYILPAINSTAYLQGNKIPQNISDYYNGVDNDGVWNPGKLELENQIEFIYDDIEFVIISASCDINEITEKLTVTQCDTEKIKNKITTLETLIKETNKNNVDKERNMNIDDDFKEIMKYAHYFNWLPDWGVVQEVYHIVPNSFSILIPFAYSYLEEMIRSTTSEYGIDILDDSGEPKRRRVGTGLINLAINENSDNQDYIALLEKTKAYFLLSNPKDKGENRNNVVHGYMHPRFWEQESFERLIHDIATLSKYTKF